METEDKEKRYVYRQQGLAKGEPLQTLHGVIEKEFKAIEQDIESLYDNWFVETCEEWVLPYLYPKTFGIERLGGVLYEFEKILKSLLSKV
ncbi:MAG: hypothetical protein V3T17_10880 [Pseudomonadales bacterium]